MMNTKFPLVSRTLTLFALMLGLSAVALTSGCLAVAAGAGAGAVAYVRGELTVTLDSSLDRTDRAANRAVQQLEFAKVSESKDALLAIIVVRNAADKKIKIQLDQAGDSRTKVRIRVGFIGDEELSMKILDKIRANL